MRPLRPREVWRLGVGALLTLARVPYLLTRAVQDDAYITWRCAVQLADTGVYGFNPGERVSASSSHAYVAMVALLRLVSGGAFIPATLAVNSALTVAAIWLVSDALAEDRADDCRDACWVLTSMSPVALVISTSGMETALFLFAIAVALHGLTPARSTPPSPAATAVTFAALAALPCIRLDGVFASLVLGLAHVRRDPRLTTRAMLATAAGVACTLAFNRLYFGVFLNQSIVAKLEGLHASHALVDVLLRMAGVYFTSREASSAFAPLAAGRLAFLGPPFVAASLAACVVLVRRAPSGSALRASLVAASVIALVTPAIYAAAAVIYAWYLWPSLLLATLAVVLLILQASGVPRARVTAALGLLAALGALAQWVVSYAAGVKDHAYVARVGAYVASRAEPGDRLFSEMAGSIPYVTGLRTDDEWGLVSPEVTRLQAALGREKWEATFLRSRQPNWVVLRGALEDRLVESGELGEDPDRAWALSHYELAQHFHYTGDDAVSPDAPSVLRAIARLGTAPDFFVYRLTTTTGRPPP